MNKAEIADHFGIGVRTVTKLMRRRILPYTKLRNLVRFGVGECDRAIGFFMAPSRVNGSRRSGGGQSAKRNWKTKRQIAEHLRLSVRTITTLMKQRILPYVKIGHVVRFDSVECDSVMEAGKVQSVVERRLSLRRDGMERDAAAEK